MFCDGSFWLELRLAGRGKFSFIHPGPPVLTAFRLHQACMFSTGGNRELILDKSLIFFGPQCAVFKVDMKITTSFRKAW